MADAVLEGQLDVTGDEAVLTPLADAISAAGGLLPKWPAMTDCQDVLGRSRV